MKIKEAINLGAILLVSIFLLANVSASFCCEKTIDSNPSVAGNQPAWCQSVDNEALCNTDGFDSVQTSCEATAYCRMGTCIDNNNGICMPNTAERTCSEAGGSWDAKAPDEIPQCQLGCCLLGEQAAFVTQVKCESLSSLYGLESSYRADITDELVCLASANPSEKGACVFTNDKNQKDCDMTTRGECQSRETTAAVATTTPKQSSGLFSNLFGGGTPTETEPTLEELGASFYAEFLCSAEELNTICGPRGGTICGDDGKVYFKDTCGEQANVYDFSKLNDNDYWTYIREPTCTDSKDSATCGNCDSLSSICSAKKVGETVSYGSNICRNLDCVGYKGENFTGTGTDYPKSGETWCANTPGVGLITVVGNNITGGDDSATNNLPGSSYYVKMCSNGEVILKDDCGQYRGKVCVQNTRENYKGAVCKTQIGGTNCYFQNNSKDCENRDARDCKWMETGYSFTQDKGLINKTETEERKNDNSVPNGICIPLYQPGFDTASTDINQNGGVCSIADSYCVVTYKVGLIDSGKSISSFTLEQKKKLCKDGGKNCQCLEDDWKTKMNSMCIAIGDCGTKNNFIGKAGEARDVILIESAEGNGE